MKTHCALAAALLALTGFSNAPARADTISLAVIAAPAEIAKATRPTQRPAPAGFCLNARAECNAVFAAALRSSERLAGERSITLEAPAAEPLRFEKRTGFAQRLETIGKEGLPFLRMPRGAERELVVGISRDGVLGFSLNERR